VVTHGFTLDEKGMKMSKSLGNIIAPEKIVQQYGADILRLWVAQTDYTLDQRIGPEILKGVADGYRRLRNTLRYMLGSLGDFTERDRTEHAEMPELERWVLHRLAELDQTVRDGYARFDFQGVYQAIFTFATVDLSAFYFDIRKDVLYCDGDTVERRAARTVLDLLFHRLTTWLAPVLVFTMEEVWLARFDDKNNSVHLQDFPETPSAWKDPALATKWAGIRNVRRVVTSALEFQRQEKEIGSSLEAAPLVEIGDDELRGWVESVNFADICITSSVEVVRRMKAKYGDVAQAKGYVLPEVPSVHVVPRLAEGEKCARCWKILPDVGTHKHDGVCARCDAAVG
jgi:isoleucyl-tRNA synthetase